MRESKRTAHRDLAHEVAVMYLGRIVEMGKTPEIFANAQHPYTKALLSAVPTMETRPFDSRDHLLEGEPPSPIDLPPGCSFASRCPQRFEPCVLESPKLMERDSGNCSACFLLQRPPATPAAR